MNSLFRVGWYGFFISFLGSLPICTMNVVATNIAVRNGVYTAMTYAVGSMLVEIIYVRAALVAMDWFQKRHKIFRLFEWFTVIVILALAGGSFMAAIQMKTFSAALPEISIRPFLLGALLSATNPLHIPF